jgi:hypothetical protein
MDWTYKLRQKFGFADTTDAAGTLIPARKTPITEDSNYLAPSLKVDGPYGSASEEVFDYHTVMLVGAGIGVTPFISVLRSINIRMSNRSADEVENMRVYFYWICRDPDEFSQFSDIFDSLLQNNLCQGRLEINTYVTGEINLKTIQHERYNQVRQNCIKFSIVCIISNAGHILIRVLVCWQTELESYYERKGY